MVVAALWQDHWFILDNLTLMLVPDEASEYVSLLVLDDKGVRSYVVPADPVPRLPRGAEYVLLGALNRVAMMSV